MTWGVRAFGVSIVGLMLALPAYAGELAGAPVVASPTARLAATKTHTGIGVSVESGVLRLSSCDKSCDEQAATLVNLPIEVQSAVPTTEIWSLAGGIQVLHVRLGTVGQRVYSIVALAADKAVPRAAPQLVLRGFTGGSSGLEIGPVNTGGKVELLVSKRRPGLLCGRDAISETRRLDLGKREFVVARLPVFEAAERQRAPRLEVLAPAEPSKLLELRARFSAANTEKSRLLLDGRAEIAARDPWGTLVMDLPAGTRALRVQRPASEAAPVPPGGKAATKPAPNEGQIWLLVGDKLSRVSVPRTGGDFEIPLGLAQATCVALVSDADALPLAEVSAFAEYGGDTSSEALVKALESEATEQLAQLALLARGEAGELALAQGYPQLSGPGQKAALALGTEFTGDHGARVELAAWLVASGPSQSELGERIVAHGEEAVPALRDALKAALPTQEGPLLGVLERVSPRDVVLAASEQLDQKSAARRQAVRDFLARLSSEPGLVPEFRARLADTKRPRRARIELLRALGPQLQLYRAEAGPELSSLLTSSSFREQYLLLEPALLLAADEHAVGTQLEALSKKLPEGWSKSEQEAWLVRELDGFAEQPRERKVPAAIVQLAAGLLEHESVRVRRAAAALLGERGSKTAGLQLIPLLEADPWPLAREAAARALGQLGPQSSTPLPLERAITDALSGDESAAVRRAAARSLREFPSESSLEALRWALERDAAPIVRAEAALGLGRRCDRESLEALTELAQQLEHPLDESQVEVSMAALVALAELSPSDLPKRLEPLRAPDLPGPLKGQIERAITRAEGHSCPAAK